MAPPQLKDRPISFVLHNMARYSVPVKVDLVIRPEDLQRTESSRLTVNQTLGGARADSWGPGVPKVQISGTTGWGQGSLRDGHQAFLELHETVFTRWHDERADAARAGLDPELVRLIFCDDLDGFTWVVAPEQFILRRNKSCPLLSQYLITMTYLADGVADRSRAELVLRSNLNPTAEDQKVAHDSFQSSIDAINAFESKLTGEIGAALGPLQKPVADFTKLTGRVLTLVGTAVGAGRGIVGAAVGPLINVAVNLARSGANIAAAIQAIYNLPANIKAQFKRLQSAFINAFCVMRNAFKLRAQYPNYDDVYGASTCSSTAGGRPISPLAGTNPFHALEPVKSGGGVRMSGQAPEALSRLASMDATLARPSEAQIRADLLAVNTGVVVTA